jgi:hypothetical protein
MTQLPLDPAQRALRERYGSSERERAVAYARQASLLAEMADTWDDEADLILDLAGTARAGQIRSGGTLDRALQLVRRMPVAHGLLALGVMRVATAEILLGVTHNATHEVQQAMDARLSERICELDAVDARRLVATTLPEVEAEVDEAAQRERLEAAVRDRRVWVQPVADGMVRIGAELPVLDARRFTLDLEELVRAQKVVDDQDGVVRTQSQRRADVLAALPSRLLALAEAAGKGKLDALLVQALARRAGSSSKAAGSADPSAPKRGATADEAATATADETAVDGTADLVPVPRVSPETAEMVGQGELDLGLPASSAPLWWQQDPEDLLADLLRLPVRKPSAMYLHAGMTTCLDLDQRSGLLEGYGPVPALHARMLLPDAGLRRVGVDARTGIPLGIDPGGGPVRTPWDYELSRLPAHRAGPIEPQSDPPDLAEQVRARLLSMLGPMYVNDMAEPQHDPSAALRHFVGVRDQCCDGVGCPRGVHQSELDHEQDFARGGLTAAWNLKPRSPRCHHAKHRNWDVTHDHDTRVTTWARPSGGVYERQSPWQPPTEVPEDVELPASRVEPPLGEGPDPYPAQRELPLWPQPPKPRRPRSVSADDLHRLRDDGTFEPRPEKPKNSGPSRGWDDGEPPF